MSSQPPNHARVAPVIPLRPQEPAAEPREPLWRDLVGDVLRRERLDQERTLKDVADAARISLPYLSEIERGRKEASSEVLAAAGPPPGPRPSARPTGSASSTRLACASAPTSSSCP
ncbi:helix-turn-helix domain-containing protein, partial [Streptomyces sp. NPDC059629]|uniref:helix-turn-helix domain-containing protein n=1 Tax=Streptomyces sp. NPDC059629 TaxID=3346889 RepID=UPI0036BF7641